MSERDSIQLLQLASVPERYEWGKLLLLRVSALPFNVVQDCQGRALQMCIDSGRHTA